MLKSLICILPIIAAKIDEEIPCMRKCPFDCLGKMNELTCFLSPTDSAEVESMIPSPDCKKGKSVGPYSIPCDLLKMLNESISPLLVILINESFPTGIFLDKLKSAKLKLLHFTKMVQLNYRPISLLSVFSKIFERIMHKQLYNFLEINDILHPLQNQSKKSQLIMVSLGVEFS